jgi:mannose-6-phosphate isomerase-like protein (cupin superfamily)
VARPIRRIVTGHHPDGRSTVLADGPAPNVKAPAAGNASTLHWVTDEFPADVSGVSDWAARHIGVPPPQRGTLVRVAEFPPVTGGAVRDNETVLRDFDIGADVARGHPPRHPTIHRTRTIDYVIVLEGEIDLLLDDREVRLSAGDVVVQRGTAVCRLGMVFIDAEEPAVIKDLNE